MKKKSLVGWTNEGWENYFYYPVIIGTRRNALFPFVVQQRINKNNVKVRITIEQLAVKE